MAQSHSPVDEVPMSQRCDSHQTRPNTGRTPAGHQWHLFFKTASVAARWNFNFGAKFHRALTELPHRSPIVTTSENTSAGVRSSIGRCPVHLRIPEDERGVFKGHRPSSDRVKQLIVHLWLHAEEGFEVGSVLGLEFLHESLVLAEKRSTWDPLSYPPASFSSAVPQSLSLSLSAASSIAARTRLYWNLAWASSCSSRAIRSLLGAAIVMNWQCQLRKTEWLGTQVRVTSDEHQPVIVQSPLTTRPAIARCPVACSGTARIPLSGRPPAGSCCHIGRKKLPF